MPFVEKNLDGFFTAKNAESAEKKNTTERHPPASPEGEADGGQADFHGEDFSGESRRARRHEKR